MKTEIMTINELLDKQNPSKIKTYLIQDKVSEYCKIGKSQNPDKRLKGLCQTALWHKVDFHLVCVINADVERFLHSIFAKKRIHGEWFALSPCEIVAIRDGAWRDFYLKCNPESYSPHIITKNKFIE